MGQNDNRGQLPRKGLGQDLGYTGKWEEEADPVSVSLESVSSDGFGPYFLCSCHMAGTVRTSRVSDNTEKEESEPQRPGTVLGHTIGEGQRHVHPSLSDLC